MIERNGISNNKSALPDSWRWIRLRLGKAKDRMNNLSTHHKPARQLPLCSKLVCSRVQRWNSVLFRPRREENLDAKAKTERGILVRTKERDEREVRLELGRGENC